MTALRRADLFCVVWVTVPSRAVGRRLARAVLEARLAACANLVAGVESHYWWRGRLEKSAELLVIFKTRRVALGPLERCVRLLHPYDTPEFLVLPLVAGSGRYLAWVADSVPALRRRRRAGRVGPRTAAR